MRGIRGLEVGGYGILNVVASSGRKERRFIGGRAVNAKYSFFNV